MSTPKYIELLNQRRMKGSERSLLSFDASYSDFWSNDYLGFGKMPMSVVLRSGSGSRLISGNSQEIEKLESMFADFFQAECGLFFNSGYDANLGLFSCLPQKGETVIYDEYAHASIRDGLRLTFAQSFGFKHNDLNDLRKKLSLAAGTTYVVVESIYSMDGDLAPLKEILDLCDEFNALLIVDEAHAGGIYGPNGSGKCVELELHNQIFARIITFGKAFGAHGAVVLTSHDVRQFLINFARSFIYTTALPEGLIQHAYTQVVRLDGVEKRAQLFATIRQFRNRFVHTISDPSSPIQVMTFRDAQTCQKTAEKLQLNGFAVKAILPPTVPENAPRLRFCLHAFNTDDEIERLFQLLKPELAEFESVETEN